jgi:acetylornithine deacetylase/succinyl-diaminopimelate desuccinylase-like protein
MRVIAELARSRDGAPVVSRLTRGFTDCHFFRERRIPCLGFIPRRSTPSDEGRAHGVDERISVESLKAAMRTMFELVRRLATQ